MNLKRSHSHPDNPTPNIGLLGEDFVAQYLQTQAWVILHRRWHCRWGELDIIAQQEGGEQASRGESFSIHPSTPTPCPLPYLVFVEVKTRSHRNWDADGLLSITARKQAKLWQAALLFLGEHPEFAEYPCRFDVALVNYQRISQKFSPDSNDPALILPDRAMQLARYRFFLQDYIQSAFSF